MRHRHYETHDVITEYTRIVISYGVTPYQTIKCIYNKLATDLLSSTRQWTNVIERFPLAAVLCLKRDPHRIRGNKVSLIHS